MAFLPGIARLYKHIGSMCFFFERMLAAILANRYEGNNGCVTSDLGEWLIDAYRNEGSSLMFILLDARFHIENNAISAGYQFVIAFVKGSAVLVEVVTVSLPVAIINGFDESFENF